jgi:hypothetical protein
MLRVYHRDFEGVCGGRGGAITTREGADGLAKLGRAGELRTSFGGRLCAISSGWGVAFAKFVKGSRRIFARSRVMGRGRSGVHSTQARREKSTTPAAVVDRNAHGAARASLYLLCARRSRQAAASLRNRSVILVASRSVNDEGSGERYAASGQVLTLDL